MSFSKGVGGLTELIVYGAVCEFFGLVSREVVTIWRG